MRAFHAAPAVLLCLALAGCGGLSLGRPSATAAGCADLPPPDPALAAPLDRYALDQWLIDDAVRHEVNVLRCRRGLAPLAADPALARAAAYHSGDMVTRDFFDHISPVAGRRTPDERATETGTRFTRIAENIATLPVYAIEGRKFIMCDPATCDFAFSRTGPAIAPHSYAAAAAKLVESWMDSPGHRRNLLDPNVTRIGTGAAVKQVPAICGELVVTQLFAN